MWFINHILGGTPGLAANLWGGFGSDIAEFALIGGLWRMINCHEKGCWRPGHHVNGTVVCHKHRKGNYVSGASGSSDDRQR